MERNGVAGVGREGRDGNCGVDRVTENVVEGWSRIVVSGSDAGATEMDLAKFYVTIELSAVMLVLCKSKFVFGGSTFPY